MNATTKLAAIAAAKAKAKTRKDEGHSTTKVAQPAADLFEMTEAELAAQSSRGTPAAEPVVEDAPVASKADLALDKAARKAEREARWAAAREAKALATAAKNSRKRSIADLRAEAKAIKARGTLTADDKARLEAIKGSIHLLRGTGGGKARVAKLLGKAQRLLGMAVREARRYNARTEHGDVDFNGRLAALDEVITSTTDFLGKIELVRKVKPTTSGGAARVAKPKVEPGCKAFIAQKHHESYIDLLNTADALDVIKVVGKKAVVLDSDRTRGVVPLAHLERSIA